MPRIKVTRLRKFCGRLAGHAMRRAQRVTAAAIELVASCLADGQEDVSLKEFMICLALLLEQHRDGLTSADNRHQHKLTVDHGLRLEREALTVQVREGTLQLRDSLDGLYGASGTLKILEDGPAVPTDPMALHQFVGHGLDNLDDDEFPMPAPLQEGITLDRKQVAGNLRQPWRRLGTVLKRLEGTESDSKYSQSRKDVRVGDTDVFALKVARFLEAFYALVGLDEMARRVRLSTHRATGGADTPENDGLGDEPETSDAEPSEAQAASA